MKYEELVFYTSRFFFGFCISYFLHRISYFISLEFRTINSGTKHPKKLLFIIPPYW
jgi:hypothetical protein